MDQLKQLIGDNIRTIDEEDDTDAKELLAEIAGDGVENQDTATPPEGHPQEMALDLADYIHSIPDNQSPNSDGEGVQNPELVKVNKTMETPPLANENKKG